MPSLNGPQWQNVERLTDKEDYRSVGATLDTDLGRHTYMAKVTPGGVNVDVTEKGNTVGSLYGVAHENNPSSIEITGIDVSPRHRRRGIATNMLQFARQHAFEGTSIDHSTHLTGSGEKFVKGLKDKGID